MTILLIIHLIALGIWIGVVGAEFAIEFDGMKDDESYIKASNMRYATDTWIEIPAFTIVLLTGLLMLNESHLSGLFLYKLIFGLLAIMFNSVCVYAVFKRKKFAEKFDIEGMKSVNPIMKVGGANYSNIFNRACFRYSLCFQVNCITRQSMAPAMRAGQS